MTKSYLERHLFEKMGLPEDHDGPTARLIRASINNPDNHTPFGVLNEISDEIAHLENLERVLNGLEALSPPFDPESEPPSTVDCPRCGGTGEEPGAPHDEQAGKPLCSLCEGRTCISNVPVKVSCDTCFTMELPPGTDDDEIEALTLELQFDDVHPHGTNGRIKGAVVTGYTTEHVERSAA